MAEIVYITRNTENKWARSPPLLAILFSPSQIYAFQSYVYDLDHTDYFCNRLLPWYYLHSTRDYSFPVVHTNLMLSLSVLRCLSRSQL